MSKIEIPRAMDYLGHIVEAIDRIHRYVEDLTELGFLNDEKTQCRGSQFRGPGRGSAQH